MIHEERTHGQSQWQCDDWKARDGEKGCAEKKISSHDASMAGRGGVSRISICARHDATWKERTRYENMLVLKLNNEKHKGQTPNRDDFPLAVRMLAVLQRQEGRKE